MKLVLLGMLITVSSVFNVHADELLKTDKSWDGGNFAYPDGDPLITSIRVTLKQDQETPLHCHPVPAIAYIISGKLQVETASGKSTTFEAGNSLVEVMKTIHKGTALEGPVELIVFYLGAEDMPNTVLQDNENFASQCAS